MRTLAPPATASVTRARMSASGSRNTGDVIPWSSAQMTDVFVGWFSTRFSRMVLPTLMCFLLALSASAYNQIRASRLSGTFHVPLMWGAQY